jgi:hypothetical protein
MHTTALGQRRDRSAWEGVPVDDAINNRLSLSPAVQAFERVNPQGARDYRSRHRLRERVEAQDATRAQAAWEKLLAEEAASGPAARPEHRSTGRHRPLGATPEELRRAADAAWTNASALHVTHQGPAPKASRYVLCAGVRGRAKSRLTAGIKNSQKARSPKVSLPKVSLVAAE